MFYETLWTGEHWYTDGIFLKNDLDSIPSDITDANDAFEHGVNVATGLKSGAVSRV
jgi:uncharacterized NAD-dependent epimerase/dehydratase family protein